MRLDDVLEAIHRHTMDAILITEAEPLDQPGPRIVFANKAFLDHSGYSNEDLIGKTPRILQGPDSDMAAIRRMGENLRQWKPIREQLVNYKKDGSRFVVDLSILPVADEAGWVHYWVSVQRDVTFQYDVQKQIKHQRDLLEQQARQLSLIEDHLNQAQMIAKMGSWRLDLETNEVWWSKGLYEIYGLEPSMEVPSFEEHRKLFTEESWQSLMAEISRTIEEGVPYELDLETVKYDGTSGWLKLRGEVILDSHGQKAGIQGIAQDITDQKTAELKLSVLALTDPLTGVGNRAAFSESLERSIKTIDSYGGNLMLMLIDMDGLKRINDTQGHAAGDQALKHVAAKLKSYFRKADVIARWGGDEFAVLVNHLGNRFDHARKVTGLIEEVTRPVDIGGTRTSIHASIGISFYPQDASDAQSLLERADRALYAAKKVNGSAYRVYSEQFAPTKPS
ncbi:sensor domain-containing diguanylate cyclase [Roseicyclus marinus]|uniref:sensor domain-containing diguanylate cyclase n=1 Tax=Roseicyclus marinus TaxID=2161673 RepID=UPI00240FB21A|nr:sensor domain-containing diguanylate cyclase [Roseicyclus marinus]MDG3040489.1 diguanylate cyclase [Roseicyclus marinus]